LGRSRSLRDERRHASRGLLAGGSGLLFDRREHRELALTLADILDVGSDDISLEAETRAESWHAQNLAGVNRALQVLSDIRMGGLSSLETLSVALREVRNLIQSGTRVAPPPELPPEATGEPLPLPPESLRLS